MSQFLYKIQCPKRKLSKPKIVLSLYIVAGPCLSHWLRTVVDIFLLTTIHTKRIHHSIMLPVEFISSFFQILRDIENSKTSKWSHKKTNLNLRKVLFNGEDNLVPQLSTILEKIFQRHFNKPPPKGLI